MQKTLITMTLERWNEHADEIERLRQNAKINAQYLEAYHYICEQHGIAPSSSDLINAMKAVAIAKATDDDKVTWDDAVKITGDAIAKATGGE